MSFLNDTARFTCVIALGLGLGVSIGLLTAEQAGASQENTAWVMPGLSGGDVCWDWDYYPAPKHDCWHDDEAGTWTALDLNQSDGDDAGVSVYWRQWGSDSTQVVSVRFASLDATNCTGIKVVITSPNTDGAFNYKHIDPAAGVIGSTTQYYMSLPGYFLRYRYLGDTSTSQPSGCAFSGSHLHQSGQTDWETEIWTNWAGPTGNCSGNFCEWPIGEWTHKILWPE